MSTQSNGLPHIELVKASIRVRRIGWYATRQNLLKKGATAHDIAKVLAWQLEILGVEFRKGSDEYLTRLRESCADKMPKFPHIQL